MATTQEMIDELRRRAANMVSLDTPEDQDFADIGADIAMGFVPVVGTAQAGRDFERARRDKDKLGMVLSAAAGIPVVGGVAKAANKGRKAKKSTEATVKALREKAGDPARAFEKKALTGEQQAYIDQNIPPPTRRTISTEALDTPEGMAEFQQKYGRTPLHLMDPSERVRVFGDAMAESAEVVVKDPKTGRELVIPGGFEGVFSLADSAKISAQGIDYNDLDPDLALKIHRKIVRSVDPGKNPSDVEQVGRLAFGISSGNAPITKNLIEYAQIRPRSTEEIGEWARYAPGAIGEQLPTNVTNETNKAIAAAKGVQASGDGGTGVRNTSNYTYISDLAKMYEKNPTFFSQGGNEADSAFVERLINQVRGLGPKTGSLGIAMTNPQASSVSAIDRHIADLTYQDVRSNPTTQDAYRRAMLNAYNLELRKGSKKPVKKYETARGKFGDEAEDIERRAFRNVVSTPEEMMIRPKKLGGAANPDLPSELQPSSGAYPFYEPTHAQYIPPFYKVALDKMRDLGSQRGIGGFSNQWYDWDYKRSRAEPHAALNPMASTLKEKLTPEEYALVRDQFSSAGAFRTAPDPKTGRLSPLKADMPNWRRYMYGKADPTLLALMGAGAGGAATIAALRAKNDEDDE